MFLWLSKMFLQSFYVNLSENFMVDFLVRLICLFCSFNFNNVNLEEIVVKG